MGKIPRRASVSNIQHSIYRRSCPGVFLRKGILKIYNKFTGEPPCRSVISINLQSNFNKIALWHVCSSINLLHFSRTHFYKNNSRGLLLHLVHIYLEMGDWS